MTKNYVFTLAFTFLTLSSLTSLVKADLERIPSNSTPESLVFVLTGWKDNGKVGQIQDSFGDLSLQDAFQFTFTAGKEGNATLTFDFSDLVKNDPTLGSLVGGGDKGLKFKDFDLTGFTIDGKNIFATSNLQWDNGGWTPTSTTLTQVRQPNLFGP